MPPPASALALTRIARTTPFAAANGMSGASMRPAAAPRFALVLVADRQRPDDALGSRGDPGGSLKRSFRELGRVEGLGELEETE